MKKQSALQKAKKKKKRQCAGHTPVTFGGRSRGR